MRDTPYDDSGAQDPLEQTVAILVVAGPFAYGKDTELTAVATEWLDHGFSPQETHDWLMIAHCFFPQVAKKLKALKLTPDHASLDASLKKPSGSHKTTIGYRVADGSLTPTEAARLTAPLRTTDTFFD